MVSELSTTRQRSASFLGIDVTSGKRPFSYAVVSCNIAKPASDCSISGVLEVGFIPGSTCIPSLVKRLTPAGIAIDCPSGLPQGLQHCCLQTPVTCGCIITSGWRGKPATMRQCEHELRAIRINSYATNKNSTSDWKNLVSSMSPVWNHLQTAGYQMGTTLLETYPYAIWRRLFARSPFTWRKGVKNDTYDAVLCALVAVLHSRGQTQALGNLAEGQIVLPA